METQKHRKCCSTLLPAPGIMGTRFLSRSKLNWYVQMRPPFLAISLANCYFTFKNIFMLPSLEDSYFWQKGLLSVWTHGEGSRQAPLYPNGPHNGWVWHSAGTGDLGRQGHVWRVNQNSLKVCISAVLVKKTPKQTYPFQIWVALF